MVGRDTLVKDIDTSGSGPSLLNILGFCTLRLMMAFMASVVAINGNDTGTVMVKTCMWGLMVVIHLNSFKMTLCLF